MTVQLSLTPSATRLGIQTRRVLFVTARYLPYVGGTEIHTYQVAKRMKSLGFKATVLTTDPLRELAEHEAVDGVDIIRVPSYPKMGDYYFAPQIVRIIQQRKWDLVHCQGYHTFVAPMALTAAMHAKIPYILSFHSGGHSSAFRNALRLPQQVLLRPLLKRAAKLVAVSRFEAELFQRRLALARENFVVIPNGVDFDPSTLPWTQTKAPPQAPFIVSVGRLERYKGHHRILAALPFILKEFPDARLRIVGTGTYEAELRRMARQLNVVEQVEIKGIRADDRQGMAEVLSKASLVALLSDYEAHPVSAIEAIAAGCPLLVADTSALQEFAAAGAAQAIPIKSSPEDIAKAVLGQIRKPRIPNEVKLSTWDTCASDLAELYRKILSPPFYSGKRMSGYRTSGQWKEHL